MFGLNFSRSTLTNPSHVTPTMPCRALLELLKQDIKPRDIMTKQAFENAITVVMALGGSTNAVLHLLAMALSVDVPLSIDDFQTISDRTPFIADLKPSGKYVMEDIHKVMSISFITITITTIITTNLLSSS